MLRYLIILLLVFLPMLPVRASEEGREHTALAVLVAVDWLQTRQITESTEFFERNPIMGNRPSPGEVDTYFAAMVGLYLLVQEILPERTQDMLRRAFIGAEIYATVNNFAIGVRF